MTYDPIGGMKSRFAEGIRDRANLLRDVADELDRRADKVAAIGTPDFRGVEFADNAAWIASQVQHEVIGILPNLTLDHLTVMAHDIDLLIRDGRP